MLDQPLIKLLLIAGIVVVTAMLTRSTAGARHQAIRRLLLVAFVVLAVVAVLFPRLLTEVARALGVGRGADLLLYGLTVVFLGYVASSYRRMREMEMQVTTLARELAVRDAVVRERQDHVEEIAEELTEESSGAQHPPGALPPGGGAQQAGSNPA